MASPRFEQPHMFTVRSDHTLPYFLLPSPAFAGTSEEAHSSGSKSGKKTERRSQEELNVSGSPEAPISERTPQNCGTSTHSHESSSTSSQPSEGNSVPVITWESFLKGRPEGKKKRNRHAHDRSLSLSPTSHIQHYAIQGITQHSEATRTSKSVSASPRKARDRSPQQIADSGRRENKQIRLGVNQWRAEWRKEQEELSERRNLDKRRVQEEEEKEKEKENIEVRENERRELEAKARRKDARRKDHERRKAERKEAERKQAEREEMERKENERREHERRENERREHERRENERKEAQRIEAQRIEEQRIEEQRIEEQRIEAERQKAARRERRAREAQERLLRQEQQRIEETSRIEAQERALHYVRAAERDRQRVLQYPTYTDDGQPPPRDEYTTIEEEIPPYHAHLHRYLDLLSYDERFTPVLRVNRYLVHGEGELSAAITKLSSFNLLPKSTNLWSISHVDDRDYETMIPELIPMSSYYPNEVVI